MLFVSALNSTPCCSVKTYMSDLRFSCFFGRMICTECESLVSGIGCFMMHIARATLPTFFTCSFFKKHFRNRKHVQHMYIFSLSQENHVYLFRQVRGITDDLLALRSLSFRSHTICFTALIKLNLQTVGKFLKSSED